jgi:hypothetical protein
MNEEHFYLWTRVVTTAMTQTCYSVYPLSNFLLVFVPIVFFDLGLH